MKYNVHAYTIVRVEIKGIEAMNPGDAVVKAEEMTDFYQAVKQGEYAEEIDSFLVDELDINGEVRKSVTLNAFGEKL